MKPSIQVYRVEFSVKATWSLIVRDNVSLWVIARSIEHAIRKGRAHARKTFDDKRAKLVSAKLAGTIDVV